MRHLAAAAVTPWLVAGLVACGGGGGGGDGASPPNNQPSAAPAPTVPQSVLTGTVASVATPVTVTVQLADSTRTGQTVTLSDTTDNSGVFSISAPTSVIPKNSQVAVVITADGYLPTTVIYSTDAGGNLTPLTATNALGTQAVSGPIALAPMAQGTFVFAGLDTLHRLGDGNTNDLANSQLQLPAPPNATPILMKASQRIVYADPGKSRLRVSLLIRGLEVSTCPGARATLRSFNAASVEIDSLREVRALANSPANGEFETQTLDFAIDSVALTGGTIQLEVQTGMCTVVNHDDMEFVGTTGTLS